MTPDVLLEDLARTGVDLWRDGDKLCCRGPRRAITPELVEGLRAHKAEILERLEGPRLNNAGEVLQLARAHFGELEDQEDAPYPSPEPGRDPMVHKHTAKARFFQGVRVRDLERRKREGLPPWIRLVDGGGDAA